MKLNYLTNNNKTLEEKMRFFANYFSFVNENLGKHPLIHYDNPLSLLEKSLFQINNNFDHCPLYVSSYLSQLFTFYTPFESKAELFANAVKQYAGFKVAEEKKEWLRFNSDFIDKLRTLKDDYEANLFENNHATLLHFMKCVHPLKKHKKEIEYRTRILVSMFRLKGHSKQSLDGYVKRILSNDRYEFPLPVDIIKIKETEQYKASANEYIETRDFDRQFAGIKNLYITEHYKFGYFFFVIDNCFLSSDIKKTFKVKFDEVTFISPSHQDLKLLRRSIRTDDKENAFKTFPVFFGRNKLLAFIYKGYENKEAKKADCLRVVEEELINLNQYLDGKLQVNPLHFMVYESFDNDQWSSKASLFKTSRTRISHFDMEEAAANPYETLRNVNSPAKAIILQNEKVFLKAFSRSEVEDFWIFIENTFAPIYAKSEQIRKASEKLLMKLLDDLKDEFLIQIGNMMIPFGFNYEEENLTQDDMLHIHEEIFRKRNFKFDFSPYKKVVKSIILKDIFDHHQHYNSQSSRHSWSNHFSNLLIDLYGYRNSLLHSGKIDKYSKTKLQDVLPKLISRARWLIIITCRDNEGLKYNHLIKKILI